jgi:predicted solute-binding protein
MGTMVLLFRIMGATSNSNATSFSFTVMASVGSAPASAGSANEKETQSIENAKTEIISRVSFFTKLPPQFVVTVII